MLSSNTAAGQGRTAGGVQWSFDAGLSIRVLQEAVSRCARDSLEKTTPILEITQIVSFIHPAFCFSLRHLPTPRGLLSSCRDLHVLQLLGIESPSSLSGPAISGWFVLGVHLNCWPGSQERDGAGPEGGVRISSLSLFQ